MMSDTSKDALIKMEANIDNMNPEQYGGLLDRYLQAGANDAWMTPIIMKKRTTCDYAKHFMSQGITGYYA